MPTYNYRCASCGFEFERVQRISEDPIKDCPQCGNATASRQITQGNFILKGGGWYGDLYSGSSNKKSGASSLSSEGTSSASAGTATPAPAAPATATTTPSAPASTPSSGSSSS